MALMEGNSFLQIADRLKGTFVARAEFSNFGITITGNPTFSVLGQITFGTLATGVIVNSAHTLHVMCDAGGSGLKISQGAASATNSGAIVQAVQANIPQAQGHRIGGFFFGGVSTGTTFVNAAEMEIFADELWTSTATGAYIRWGTTAVGTTTLTERMRLTSAGWLGLGVTDIKGKLHVEGNNSTAGEAQGNIIDTRTVPSTTGGGILRMGIRYNSAGANLPTASGHRVGAVSIGEYLTGGGWTDSAQINVFSNAAWTEGTDLNSYISLHSAPLGSNAAVMKYGIGVSKVVANGGGTNLCSFAIAAGTVFAAYVRISVEVWNGTDLQVAIYYNAFQGYNKGGAVTVAGGAALVIPVSTSAGTLTISTPLTSANPAVLSIVVTSSLTPSAGYPRVTYEIHNLTGQAVTIL